MRLVTRAFDWEGKTVAGVRIIYSKARKVEIPRSRSYDEETIVEGGLQRGLNPVWVNSALARYSVSVFRGKRYLEKGARVMDVLESRGFIQ